MRPTALPIPCDVAGVALAAELNRTLVLPQLLMGGRSVDFM